MRNELKEPAVITRKLTILKGTEREITVSQTLLIADGEVRIVNQFRGRGNNNHGRNEISIQSANGLDGVLYNAEQCWEVIKREFMQMETLASGYAKFKLPGVVDKEMESLLYEAVAVDFLNKNINATEPRHLDKGMGGYLASFQRAIEQSKKQEKIEMKKIRSRGSNIIKLDDFEKLMIKSSEKLDIFIDDLRYIAEALEDETTKRDLMQLTQSIEEAMQGSLKSLNVMWFLEANKIKRWQGMNHEFEIDVSNIKKKLQKQVKPEYKQFEEKVMPYAEPDIQRLTAKSYKKDADALGIFAMIDQLVDIASDKEIFRGLISGGFKAEPGRG